MKPDTMPKYLGDILKRLKFPVIIEFQDHHRPFLHYAEDAGELGKVFIHVLSNRIDSYFHKDDYQDDADDPVLSMEEIDKLPQKYRAAALRVFKEHASRVAQVRPNNLVYADAKKAIETKNGGLAWRCLSTHEDREDEYFEITSIEDLRVPAGQKKN